MKSKTRVLSRLSSLRPLVALSVALVTLGAPLAAGAVVLKSQLTCQAMLSKSGEKYLTTILNVLIKCRKKNASSGTVNACTASSVRSSIDLAVNVFDLKVGKACTPLSEAALTGPRPAGLALVAMDRLPATQRAEYDRLADGLVDLLYGESGDSVPTQTRSTQIITASLACQSALDKAVASQVGNSFKELGTLCHDKEDRGKTVIGTPFRITDACLDFSKVKLDAAAAKLKVGVASICSESAMQELSACAGTPGATRTVSAVASCLLDRARDTVAAALDAGHGQSGPRVAGRVAVSLRGTEASFILADETMLLVAADGSTTTGQSDVNGRVEFEARPLERYRLCRDRQGSESTYRACASGPIDVVRRAVLFEQKTLELPLISTEETVFAGVVLRRDGEPCVDSNTHADFAMRGKVSLVTPRGEVVDSEREVAADGSFLLLAPAFGEYVVQAHCGDEAITQSVSASGTTEGATKLELRGTTQNIPLPTVRMTTLGGTPITDPQTISSGQTIVLSAVFATADNYPVSGIEPKFRWRVTKGDGELQSVDQTTGSSNSRVRFKVGDRRVPNQVTVWASDGRGGSKAWIFVIYPILGFTPCALLSLLTDQDDLCKQGYTSTTPDPAGGDDKFLTYKFDNRPLNSENESCLYYNIVDPQCVDLDCDGVVDPGTDPSGKCKRMTLGGWWQKNGFDSSTGLGADVASGWYLNSNDLGFGREMHCRVTSWGGPVAWNLISKDRGFGAEPSFFPNFDTTTAPLSSVLLLDALEPEFKAAGTLKDWQSLFGLFPSTVACYVANYTTDLCFDYPTNHPGNADLAFQGQLEIEANPTVNPARAYGTVAMEFRAVEGFGSLGPITKFFVYGGRVAASKRIGAANLDGCGAKNVPQVCMNCHGGAWSDTSVLDAIVAGIDEDAGVLAGIDASDTAHGDVGFETRKDLLQALTRGESGFSSFLPFDPKTYQFPAAAGEAAQHDGIRRLNQIVHLTEPSDAIDELIYGWYGNNLSSGLFAPWRPAAWNDDGAAAGDESDLYDDVYALSCRGCHAAHYSFDSPYFPSPSRLCADSNTGEAGGSPTMPHAKLTYLNLWQSAFPQLDALSTLETWYAATVNNFVSCD